MRSSDAGGNETSRVKSRGSRINRSIGSRNSMDAYQPLPLRRNDDLASHAGAVVEEAAVQESPGLFRDERCRALTRSEVAGAPETRPDRPGRMQRVVGPARIVDERRRA